MKGKNQLKNKDLWPEGVREDRDKYIIYLHTLDKLPVKDILNLVKSKFGKTVSRAMFYNIIRSKTES